MTHTERILDHLCQIENYVKRVRDELEGVPPKPAGVIARPGMVVIWRDDPIRRRLVISKSEHERLGGMPSPRNFNGGKWVLMVDERFGPTHGPLSYYETLTGDPITGYEDD